jgi:hypothetical protein
MRRVKAPADTFAAVEALFAGYGNVAAIIPDRLWSSAVNAAWRWAEAEEEE